MPDARDLAWAVPGTDMAVSDLGGIDLQPPETVECRTSNAGDNVVHHTHLTRTSRRGQGSIWQQIGGFTGWRQLAPKI